MYREKGDHLITVTTEHRAILDTAKRLEKQGVKVTHLPGGPDGPVDPDAARGVGKIPVDVNAMGIDAMSFTAHKMYGPKGVGALYVRRRNPRVRLAPQIDGWGHERGMRSGTLPVPLIVGFGKACELCEQEMVKDTARLIAMRDRLEASIMKALEESYLNGHPINRLPGNLNISFA